MPPIYFLFKGIYKMSLVIAGAKKLSETTKLTSKELMMQLEEFPSGQIRDP